MGVDTGKVDDSLVGKAFPLGTRTAKHDGTEWVYLEADSACAAMDVVIIHLDGGADPLDTTNGANSVGVGKHCAVVPETLSQSIAAGDFFWGCIYAPGTAGVKFNAVASVEAAHQLFASGTAGHLTDVIDLDAFVHGLVSLEEDDVEPVGAITFPYVADHTAS